MKKIRIIGLLFCLALMMTACKGDKKDSYDKKELIKAINEEVVLNSKKDVSEIKELPVSKIAVADDVDKNAKKALSKITKKCGKATPVALKGVKDKNYKFSIANGEIMVVVTGRFEEGKKPVEITASFKRDLENDNKMTLLGVGYVAKLTTKEKLVEAAYNTLLGMGTVFIVLIFISCIISLFGFIPKMQNAFKKKDKKITETKAEKVEEAPATESVAVTDDTELIAVIAAAIAMENNTTTDAFVVRSIKRRF